MPVKDIKRFICLLVLPKTKWILNAFLKRDSMSLQELLLFGGLRACIRNYVFLNSIDVFIGSGLNRFCV